MLKGIDEYEKVKVIRPMFGKHILDEYGMPLMHKTTEEMIDFNKIEPLGISNLSKKYNNSDKLIIAFNYDKVLLKYWNNPFKYIPLFQSSAVVCTPDFSVYSNMNYYEVAHNIYMNRWLGCLWQSHGCIALPTVSWAQEDTYDICFSGVEKGSIVIISTLGCEDNQDVFLKGYKEMIRRINPSLVIVYGKMLDGIYGRFINYKYEDAFNTNKIVSKQLRFKEIPIIFEHKKGDL